MAFTDWQLQSSKNGSGILIETTVDEMNKPGWLAVPNSNTCIDPLGYMNRVFAHDSPWESIQLANHLR